MVADYPFMEVVVVAAGRVFIVVVRSGSLTAVVFVFLLVVGVSACVLAALEDSG